MRVPLRLLARQAEGRREEDRRLAGRGHLPRYFDDPDDSSDLWDEYTRARAAGYLANECHNGVIAKTPAKLEERLALLTR